MKKEKKIKEEYKITFDLKKDKVISTIPKQIAKWQLERLEEILFDLQIIFLEKLSGNGKQKNIKSQKK